MRLLPVGSRQQPAVEKQAASGLAIRERKAITELAIKIAKFS